MFPKSANEVSGYILVTYKLFRVDQFKPEKHRQFQQLSCRTCPQTIKSIIFDLVASQIPAFKLEFLSIFKLTLYGMWAEKGAVYVYFDYPNPSSFCLCKIFFNTKLLKYM